jgi:hypothetical protein
VGGTGGGAKASAARLLVSVELPAAGGGPQFQLVQPLLLDVPPCGAVAAPGPVGPVCEPMQFVL